MSRSGAEAEAVVAEHLAERGYQILQRNWKTPMCEVDIVARHKRRIHIVEVKYRNDTAYGTGAEYVTHEKRRRLIRAAKYWMKENEYQGDIQIDVASVSGETFDISYIENAVEDPN